MELLLLLPLLLLGGLFSGGSDGAASSDEPETDAENHDIQTGTSDAEEMSGTARADLILGGRGGDLIEGLGANDVLSGEFGNDTISGDEGNDLLLGGDGNDLLDGSVGTDLVIGGAGNDRVNGGDDNDALFGSSGRDSLFGGDGDDVLVGLEFLDVQNGLAQSLPEIRQEISQRHGSAVTDRLLDRIEAGAMSGNAADTAPDILEGGRGNDFLLGDRGDTLTGDEGQDEFSVGYSDGDVATVISDFNPATETLLLLVPDPATAVINFAANGSGGTVLTVNGQPSVIFSGLTVASLTSGGFGWLSLDRF